MDYKWVVLSVTTVGTFMSQLDASIVVIGLPTVLQDLNASIVHGVWIITGYRLMVTMLLVVLGRLADLYGRVKLYNLGFAVFTVGSLFCALSRTGPQLVIARLVQGAGAALIIANSAAMITDAFPSGQLGMGLGINMMAMNVGGIAGYTLSGVMIEHLGWRSIFLLNVPVGIFGTIWGYARLREIGVRPAGGRFDYGGSILYCAGLTTVLLALTIGDPLSGRNLVVLAGGLALFAAVGFIELRQEQPTLDLRLFKIRLFAAGNVAGFLNSLAFSSGPFLRSLYLQLILGYSASKAGIMLIPMEILVFVLSPISGRLSDRLGSRSLSSLGLALNAFALMWFSTLTERSSYGAVQVSLMLFGFGRALFASPNTSSVMGCVPADKRGVANGIRMTLNQTGLVLSVPFSLLLMTLVMPYDRLSHIVSSSQLVALNEVPIFLKAVNRACFLLGVVTLLAIIPSMLRGPRTTIASAPTSGAREEG